MNSITTVAPEAGRAAGERTIVPVILSGGTGTRLWPVSRKSFPKQFWPLVSDRSLIQDTALRGRGAGFAPPVVVCNQEHRFVVAEQLRAAGIEGARILLEPVGRNSAPAITAAALLVAMENPQAILWMMASDAAIPDVDALHAVLETAAGAAAGGRIVTFGMKPKSAETGFGYIEVGEALSGAAGAFAVGRFVEKPDAPTAAALVASGTHLWNSGMFVFTAETLIEEMQLHAPDVVAPRWCRPTWSGPMSAAGMRSGSSPPRMVPAMSATGMSCSKTRKTASSAPTVSSPPCSASRTWRSSSPRMPCSPCRAIARRT
jgi:mannose-1-phosphate guanylyltransferase / mannose-6-phosphate isomerase